MSRFVAVIVLAFFADTAIAMPAPEEFGTLPNIHDAAISPDGTQIAVITNNNGQYAVRVLGIGEKNAPLRAVRLDIGVKPSWVRWVNDDRVFVSFWQSQMFRGVPISSSYIYTLDTQKMKGDILVHSRKIMRQNNSRIIDFLDDDPKHVLMGFSNEDQFVVDVQRVNVATGKARRVKRGKPGIQSWYTDQQNELRVGQGLSDQRTEEGAWNLTIRDTDGDKWRGFNHYPGLAAKTPIFGFTADPNELIIGDYADKATMGLYVYDLSQKKITRQLFHNDAYDAQGLVTDDDGNVVGATYVSDARETELFGGYETLLQKVRDQFSQYTVDYIDQSDVAGRVIFKLSNAYEPGVLAMIDAATEQVTVLASYYPGLDTKDLGAVAAVTYKARDEFEVPAYIIAPASIAPDQPLKNLPFVVLPHGGPYARTAKRFD